MPGQRGRSWGLTLPKAMLDEVNEAAEAQDRSLSYVLRLAWRLARAELAKMPAGPRAAGGDPP